MAKYPLSLINPGAEIGDTSGWTTRSGGGFTSVTTIGGVTPHSGSRLFRGQGFNSTTVDQQIDVSAWATAIDAGTGGSYARAYQSSTTGGTSASLYIEAIASDGTTILGTSSLSGTQQYGPVTWYVREEFYPILPVGTRYLRIGTINTRGDTGSICWDDFYLEISDNAGADYPTALHAAQALVLTAINFPSAEDRTTQVFGLITAGSTPDLRNDQAFCLVAIKTGAEDRTLRAWTFTQDDHDFYVLQLGASTYIYDKSTSQWCQWVSPDAAYWRGNDGCDWAGINVCCDPDTGQIYKIDADNRLDYTTTPIVSQIFGGMSERFRSLTPCYMAEVALSQARPPAGIDASTVGIQLRTYDTISWINHGTLQGQPTGDMLYARFYGLGLMKSPGILFEITDTGYARRIDGLNIEMGGKPDEG